VLQKGGEERYVKAAANNCRNPMESLRGELPSRSRSDTGMSRTTLARARRSSWKEFFQNRGGESIEGM
jgi:hypothetical protein